MSYEAALFKTWSEGGHRPPEKYQIITNQIKNIIVVITAYNITNDMCQQRTCKPSVVV